jgi:hypothetical protein
MKKKVSKVAIDPAPWCCAICGEGNQLNKKRGKIRHHVSYTPEITIILCKRCHLRLHGTGRCFNHPFEKQFGPDKGPYIFAKRVVLEYDNAIGNKSWVTQVDFVPPRDAKKYDPSFFELQKVLLHWMDPNYTNTHNIPTARTPRKPKS